MAEWEKVIKGLECCREMDNPPGWRVGGCEDCPYKPLKGEDRCAKSLKVDALNLLKAQEPRVLTLDEAREAALIPIWFEAKSTNKYLPHGWMLAYMVQKGMGITGERLGMSDPSGRMHWFKLNDYGKTWRCWTSRPTDKQKETIAWQKPENG